MSHKGNVNIISWNDKYRKLTSCDSLGTIIVYIKNGDEWDEEMVNNRKQSRVADMKWSPDGTKICIAYEDGYCIVGGVEGNRRWGKEMKHKIEKVSWAPNSHNLLVGTPDGEIFIYDEAGEFSHIMINCGLQQVVEP